MADENESSASSAAEQAATGNPEMAALKIESEKFKNDYLYLRAEFENYKRNVIKERQELLRFGSERLITEILGVVDNFERALENKVTAENLPTFVKGIEMTQQELKNVLGKFGVTEVPALGQNFDPNIHEALSSEETNQYKPGQISRVFKKPYKLHDKVIRPGQVVVAKEQVEN